MTPPDAWTPTDAETEVIPAVTKERMMKRDRYNAAVEARRNLRAAQRALRTPKDERWDGVHLCLVGDEVPGVPTFASVALPIVMGAVAILGVLWLAGVGR
jgi:hypothetical protein